MRWRRTPGLEAGQRFVPTEATYGTATVGAWEVVELFEGTDGRAYARVATLNRVRLKTVARAALLDSRLYRRVAGS